MYVYTNIRIFDGIHDTLLEGQNVFVKNNYIEALADHNEPFSDDYEIIDGGGKVLMPGLIDAHVHAYATDINLFNNDKKPPTLIAHIAGERLGNMLGRGFTTVRDCGGGDYGLAMALNQDLIKGPRLIYCEKIISQTGGHGDFRSAQEYEHEEGDCWSCGCSYSGHLTVTADGVDEVRRVVRNSLRRGASFIKFAASGGISSTSSPLEAIQYSDEEVLAIIDEVERFDTYCTAHIHPDKAIRRAIDLGVHCIEHGTMISRETAEIAANKGTTIIPTLAIAATLLKEAPAFGYPEASMRKLEKVVGAMFEGLQHMKDAGVRVGFGTDLLGHLEKYQCLEFELRAKVYSPIEILKQATSVNAEILGLKGEIGIISSGAKADLLLLNGNPLEDITIFDNDGSHIAVLMQGGELLIDEPVH